MSTDKKQGVSDGWRWYEVDPDLVGPFRVVPNKWQAKPYKFAVVGKSGKPIAFCMTEKVGEGYVKQMNEKGFIENP